MSLCSKILNGLINECSRNQGGISSVWIASLSTPLTVNVDEGIITYIGDGSSIPFNPFVKYEFKKGNASMQTKVNVDTATNNKYYDTTLTITLPKVETVKLLEVDNLLESNNLAAIVGDNNGYYWFLGLDYPMTVTSVDDSWGSNRKDANNIKVTFNCPSKVRPMQTTYLPWEYNPQPPRPSKVYDINVLGTYNITDESQYFENNNVFLGSDSYFRGVVAKVMYVGSENFDGWYIDKTLVSTERKYSFEVTKNVDIVGLISPITPPTPTKFYDVTVYGTYNITDESQYFEDENTLIGTDSYAKDTLAVIKYVGSENFEGWYVNKTLVSSDREYSFEVTSSVDIVGLISSITPPTPTKFYDVTVYGSYGSVTDDRDWFEDENTLIGTDSYAKDAVALVEYIGDDEFEGWYIDGTLVSTKTNYSFEVTKNVDIIAKLNKPSQPNNEIWYKTMDEQIVNVDNPFIFFENVVSNTYEDGQGIIKFDNDLSMMANLFANNTNVIEVSIPNSTPLIQTGAFNGCVNLKKVNIPPTITEIYANTFQKCQSLTEIEIPDSVTKIGASAFFNCSSLERINIPSGITKIDSYAFQGCKKLTSVTIPNLITTIKPYTFQGCSSLTEIEIPDSVTYIDASVFANCSSLTKITMPSSVEWIGKNTFYQLPTSGTLYCDSTWYNNLGETMITNLGNVYNWTKVWL